ncbi:MAG TPA: hypothetical protein VF432_21785 [Thermoanaerobaculia bacterium]
MIRAAVLTLLFAPLALGGERWSAAERLDMAARVRTALAESWAAYKTHAWNLRIADRPAVHVRQSEDRAGQRRGVEPGRDRRAQRR